ncbi:MAG TPA: LuxR C-terminal-related transcriptional regulator [Aldersonia sp.]
MPGASEARRCCRIGVVEDHETQVIGIAAVLADVDDLEFVLGAPTVADLLAQTTDLDLVLLDLRLADGTTPRANVEELRTAGIESLVVTSAEDPYLVRSAAQAEVLGVIRKSAPVADLVDAIRRAARGEHVPTMDWAVAIDIDTEFTTAKLSPRQREVLELYAAGESAQRVASATGLSVDTVNLYLGRIRAKYAEAGRPAPTKTDLYKRAVEDGWLPVPRRSRRK